jgi:hypothetical protein
LAVDITFINGGSAQAEVAFGHSLDLHAAELVSLGSSQGGWVDFSLKRKGLYPFVTHNFADMTLGAEGALIASDAAPADTTALK